MASLLEALKAELVQRGRWNAVTEAQASQYVRAVDEVEKLTQAVSELPPGSPEHKRASTALRGAARERDTLARHLGLTERARKKDDVAKSSRPALRDVLAQRRAEEHEALSGSENERAEFVARRAAQDGAAPETVAQRLQRLAYARAYDALSEDDRLRADVYAAHESAYMRTVAEREGCSVAELLRRVRGIPEDAFARVIGAEVERIERGEA